MMFNTAPHILLIDDSRVITAGLARAFGELEFRVSSANDPLEGLRLFHDLGDVDLLIIDYEMPGLSGVEVLQQIRRNHAAVPAFILTAHGSVRSAVASYRQGISNYLLKEDYLPAEPAGGSQAFRVLALSVYFQSIARLGRHSLERQLACYERQILLHAWRDCDGNQTRMAERLQLKRTTLSEKLRRQEIDASLNIARECLLEPPAGQGYAELLTRFEGQQIEAALQHCHFNLNHAAALLGINRSTLWRKVNVTAP